MPTSSRGSATPADSGLPGPVTAALDEIETGLPTVTPTDDMARRALDADVARYLTQRLNDPIPRALLSRPQILSWCLEQVVRPPAPPSAPGSARVADPLPDRPPEAAATAEPADTVKEETIPGRYPSPRVVAARVLDVIRAELGPRFAAALARHVSTTHSQAITESETTEVARQLPAASAGRAVTELDLISAELLIRHRSAVDAARALQDIHDALGERGRRAAAAASTGGGSGGARPTEPPSPPDAPAVSLDTATGAASTRSPGGRDYPCAVAGTDAVVPDIHDIDDLTSDEDVLAAAVLATVYQSGDRMRAFRAVDAATKQLDATGDELCIDDAGLLNALSCWHELHYRVRTPERATLVARILGLSDPDLPDGVPPDPYVQPLLSDLLDAINAACNPWRCRPDPQAVQRAAQLVRARISSSMTRGAIMRITQLQVQYERAQDILIGLAPYVHGRCRPPSASRYATGAGPSEWVAVAALLGDRLPDGTDLLSAHATATAWRTVFVWLANTAGIAATVDDDLCAAAALLRPRGYGGGWSCDRSSSA